MTISDAHKDVSLLRMKFEGGRFELHALPASVLMEISRLSRIFVALAEDSWKLENPGRQRVPAKFGQRFELCLVDVTEGSTDPIVKNREQLIGEGIAPGTFPLAETAARRLEQAFIEIIRFNRLPADFPSKAERDITTIFSSLETNEYPKFQDSYGKNYSYTQHIRSRFVTSLSQEPQPSAGRVAGRLVALATERRSAELELGDGRSIKVSYLPAVQEDMRASISIPNDERFVVIEGNYLIQNGLITEITDVTEVFPVELPRSSSGKVLRELLTDDPTGEVDAITPEAAEAAGEVLRAIESGSLPIPAIFPSRDGGVQFVWRRNGERQTVEIMDPAQLEGRAYSPATGARLRRSWTTLTDLTADLEDFLHVETD